MKATKKISFIVPVYNGERYIERCVDSILEQDSFSVGAIELLLLNDGSKDRSEEIVKSYEKKFPGIVRAFSHKNIGVAHTRNKGISLARGEYIAFVDQDDYIDRDFCFTLYKAAKAGDYDVVFSGMKRPDDSGRIVSKDIYKDTEFARIMCMSIWAKLHKTEFVRSHNIQLFNNSQGEDISFTFEEFQKTDKIRGLSYCGYNWFYNRQSVSNTRQRGLNEKNIQAILRLQDRLFEIDEKRDEMTTFFITMLSAYYIFFSGRGSTREQFKLGSSAILSNLRSNRPHYLNNRYLLVAPKGILPVFSIGVKCFIILYRLKLLNMFAIIYCRGAAK